MADNWGFVLTAYGLAAVVLVAYWRRLVRREKELQGRRLASQPPRARPGVSEPLAPISGHPQSKPASRPPLP